MLDIRLNQKKKKKLRVRTVLMHSHLNTIEFLVNSALYTGVHKMHFDTEICPSSPVISVGSRAALG